MVNGVVRSVELLYHQLLALGHDVRVVTLAQNGHSHEENGILYVGSISAERVYPGVRISAAGALPISHWLDELEAWGPEVIHTQRPAGAIARWYIPTILSTRIIPSTFSSVSVWAG